MFFSETREAELKRADQSHSIPELSTVDAMVAAIKENFPKDIDFSKVAIVAIQHNLETTVTLFKALQKLGITKFHTLGKCYSDSPIIVQAMREQGITVMPGSKPKKLGEYRTASEKDVRMLWESFLKDIASDKYIDNIVVLDDGGRCLEKMPATLSHKYKVAGIEQTRGGLYVDRFKTLLCPIVNVASSALKRHVESPFIAKAVIERVKKILKAQGLMSEDEKPNSEIAIGIAGVGAIGSAIGHYLISLGYNINIYDTDEQAIVNAKLQGAARINNFVSLVANSHCVFGCTGHDLTEDLPQGKSLEDFLSQDTIFVSCSSEDKEYLGELQRIAKVHEDIDPLATFTVSSASGKKLTFVRGGFPANFDGEPWNVPAGEIEPTQCALLGGVVQAISVAKTLIKDGITPNDNAILALDPHIQQFIVQKRCELGTASDHEKILEQQFQDQGWVIDQSIQHSQFQANKILDTCFSARPSHTYRVNL